MRLNPNKNTSAQATKKTNVREPTLRRSAVRRISDVAATIGWGTVGSVASPLPGPSGNVEYFLHLRHGFEAIADDVLDRVIAEGPS